MTVRDQRFTLIQVSTSPLGKILPSPEVKIPQPSVLALLVSVLALLVIAFKRIDRRTNNTGGISQVRGHNWGLNVYQR